MHTSFLVLLAALLLLCPAVNAAQSENRGAKTLRLEIIETLPQPVICSQTPGASEIPGGFEGGNTVRLKIDGKSEYHLFAHAYETLDWSHSRLDYWTSSDGLKWTRKSALMHPHEDPASGLWIIPCSPMPFYDSAARRWVIHYCSYDSKEKQWISSNGTMMRMVSKVRGIKGIGGPYDTPGSPIFPRASKSPVDEWICSISEPYRAKDGRWVMLCTDNVWRLWLATASRPQGDFKLLGKDCETPMMSPNPPDAKHGSREVGWLENPVPVRVKGPVSGKDYWMATVDFLYDEVKASGNWTNDKIGFSWSPDGIHWPVENGQIVNLRDGLPKGTEPWWNAVRTPHALIDEGNGIYSCYFTATSRNDHGFRGIGLVRFSLKEVDR